MTALRSLSETVAELRLLVFMNPGTGNLRSSHEHIGGEGEGVPECPESRPAKGK
jgi:hypothetical protein